MAGTPQTATPVRIMYRGPHGRPERELNPWTRLSLYQSRDLLAERFLARHRRSANDGKCREIAAHLAQGNQYFESARDAGDLARPLLLYYGALSLVRAVILFAHPNLRESGLEERHGLAVPGWSNVLGGPNGGPRRVPELPILFENGTFSQLATVTENAEWTQVRWMMESVLYTLRNAGGSLEGEIGWLAVGSSDVVGGAVTVGEVLSRLPDLASLFEETMGRTADCWPLEVIVRRGPFNMGPDVPPEDRSVDFVLGKNRIQPANDRDVLSQIGLSFPADAVFERDSRGQLRFSTEVASRSEVVRRLPPLRVNAHGVNYAVSPLANGLKLSTISMYLLCAYALGMLVRYYPTTWQTLASISTGDRTFPLVKAATAEIERRFPIEIADFFDRTCPLGKTYCLSPPDP